MKYFLLTAGLIFTLSTAYSQESGFSKLYRYDDTSNNAESVTTLAYDSLEKALYFSFSSIAQTSGHYSSAFVKADMNGNVLKILRDTFPGGVVSYQSFGKSYDEEYLYWGGSGAALDGDTLYSNWILVKTDKDLNVIWKKYYPTGTIDAAILSIKVLGTDEHLILLLNAYTSDNNSQSYPVIPSRIQLKEIDSSGNILSSLMPGPSYYNIPVGMERMNDGNFLIGGRTFSWGISNGRPFSLKSNIGGTELWHQVYAADMSTTYVNSLTKAHETNEYYYIAGQSVDQTNAGFAYLNKIDANGNELWHRHLSVNGVADVFFDVTTAANRDVVAAGGSYFEEGDYARGLLTKLAPDGTLRWNRFYTENHPSNLHDYLFKVVALPNGVFIAGGGSWGPYGDNSWSNDAWLIKVDSNGCITSDCSDSGTAIKSPVQTGKILLYPNPTTRMVTLESNAPLPVINKMELIDCIGRAVQIKTPMAGKNKITYDLEGFSSEVYFLKISGPYINQTIKIHLLP